LPDICSIAYICEGTCLRSIAAGSIVRFFTSSKKQQAGKKKNNAHSGALFKNVTNCNTDVKEMRNYLPQGTKYTKLQLNNVLNDVPGKSYPANAGIPG